MERHSARYVYYVIGLLAVVNVFNYMDRVALAVLLPYVKADLNLSDGELGLLVGLAFSIFYAVCGIPIARLADRGMRRNVIAVSLTVWSVMTALSGMALNFWHLFAARIGVGAGEAGCLPPAQSLICDYVPPKQRPAVFAIHNVGLFVGMMLGMALAGVLGEAIGWRWTFVVLGAPGVVLAVVVVLTLREPARGGYDSVAEHSTDLSFTNTVRVLWRRRTYRLLMVFLVVNGFVQFGLHQWWPSFYVRVHGLSLSSVGFYLGMAMGIGSAIGLLGGGIIANKVVQHDVKRPLLIAVASVSLAMPTALGVLFVPSMFVSVALVSLTALLWSVPTGSVLATLHGVTHPRMRATASAISIFFTSVIGFGLGPLCVGLLSDLLQPSLGGQALRYALLAPVCLFPVLVVSLYAVANALPHDVAGARI